MKLNLYEINEFNKELKKLNDSLNNEDNKKILENAQKRKQELNDELKEIQIHQIQNDGNLTRDEWLKKDFLEKEIVKHEETISKIETEREANNKKIFEKRLQKEDMKRQLNLEEAQVEIELSNIQKKWNEAISEINNNTEKMKHLRLANRELPEESEEVQNNLNEILRLQNENEELKLIMQENTITSKKGMEINKKLEEIKSMKNILESGAILEGIKNPNEKQEKPEGTKAEETKPEGTKPEGTKPEGTKPEGTKPEGTKPEETKPEGTQTESEYSSIDIDEIARNLEGETEKLEKEIKKQEEAKKLSKDAKEIKEELSKEDEAKKLEEETRKNDELSKDRIAISLDTSTGLATLSKRTAGITSYVSCDLERIFNKKAEKEIRKKVKKLLKEQDDSKHARKVRKLSRKMNPAVLELLHREGKNGVDLIGKYMDAVEQGDKSKLPFIDYNMKLNEGVYIEEKAFTRLNRYAVRDNKNLGTEFQATPWYTIKKVLNKFPKNTSLVKKWIGQLPMPANKENIEEVKKHREQLREIDERYHSAEQEYEKAKISIEKAKTPEEKAEARKVMKKAKDNMSRNNRGSRKTSQGYKDFVKSLREAAHTDSNKPVESTQKQEPAQTKEQTTPTQEERT